MDDIKNADQSEIGALLKSRLALAFIIKNEGRYALQMLRSVTPIVGFVSCIDTGSTDDTIELIASELDSSGVEHSIKCEEFSRFDESRNSAIKNVPGNFEWILMLDSDEILIEKDFKKIYELVNQDKHDAWMLPRYNWIDKIWGSLTPDYPDHQGRLFKNYSKNPIKYVGRVHECLSGYRSLGKVDAGLSRDGELGDGVHIHHIKLFTKTNDEIEMREPLYKDLIEKSKMEAEERARTEERVVDAVRLGSDDKSEQIFGTQQIRAIHALNLGRFDRPCQKVFWCEWNHPLETPRSLENIIDTYILSRWPDYIRPGATCIDIGAHTGDTTIPMALFANDYRKDIRGKVFAIEPNPDVYGVLEINTALNSHLGEIIPVCVAITEKNGEIEIFDHGNSNCNGGIIDESYSAELTERLQSAAKSSFKAEGLNLEFFVNKFFSFNDLRSFSFLKIDCEGYDKEILRSAKGLIMSKQPIIQIEWFDWFTAEESADLFKAISEIDYIACDPRTGNVVTENHKIPDLLLVAGKRH